MRPKLEYQVTGVIGANSSEYLQAIVDLFASGVCAATLRHRADEDRIALAGITDIRSVGTTAGWVTADPYVPRFSHDIAQLSFSSGTEGKPKAIALSHAALANTTRRLHSVMQLDASIREYVGVPVYYSFGFGRFRAVSSAGGSVYLPPNGFDVLELAEMLKSGDINAISAVPSLLRIVLSNSGVFRVGALGERVRWIEIGSQYMSRREKEELKELFPLARIVQHYGLTEASRTTFLVVNETEGNALESVGTAYGESEVRIDGTGRIAIRGPHLASGLVQEGGSVPLTDPEGWLTTNDVGHMDEGRLFFDGRADDLINCGGVKVDPNVLERALLSELGAMDGVAVAKVPDTVRGEAVLVAYLPHDGRDEATLKKTAQIVLKRLGLEIGQSIKFFQCASIPLTETGKIKRKDIATLYLARADAQKAVIDQQQAKASTPSNSSPDEQTLVAIWEDVLGVRPISTTESFLDLGGDSLSAIRAALKMEQAGVPRSVCQQVFAGRTISEIAQGITNTEKSSLLSATTDAVTFVRGILVLLVIASHWQGGLMARLPPVFAEFNTFLSTLYSAGTPGFAVMFGVGIAFFYLPRYLRQPSSIGSISRLNGLILGSGIVCLAIARVAAAMARGDEITPIVISNSFWSVLTYYFAIVLTIPYWLRILNWKLNFGHSCILAALGCYALQIVIGDFISPAPSENPFIQPIILLLTAYYSYFEMTAGVLLGAAIGYWLRGSVRSDDDLLRISVYALFGACIAILLSYEMGDISLWFVWPKDLYLWSWLFYASAVAAGIASFALLLRRRTLSGFAMTGMRLISLVGILAFPLFVAHELVPPIKDLLDAFDVPASIALSLVFFFGLSAFLVHRFYRFYFGSVEELDLEFK
jgi:acyl-coenzyme A synthetase/AMP-(fatty) acid ligase